MALWHLGSSWQVPRGFQKYKLMRAGTDIVQSPAAKNSIIMYAAWSVDMRLVPEICIISVNHMYKGIDNWSYQFTQGANHDKQTAISPGCRPDQKPADINYLTRVSTNSSFALERGHQTLQISKRMSPGSMTPGGVINDLRDMVVDDKTVKSIVLQNS
jgi:hypothetical protein